VRLAVIFTHAREEINIQLEVEAGIYPCFLDGSKEATKIGGI
jgi:hypothetical protein